jgi:hypothetical protein
VGGVKNDPHTGLRGFGGTGPETALADCGNSSLAAAASASYLSQIKAVKGQSTSSMQCARFSTCGVKAPVEKGNEYEG